MGGISFRATYLPGRRDPLRGLRWLGKVLIRGQLAALGLLFYHERLIKRAEGYFRKALEIDSSHVLAKNKLEELVGPDKRDIMGEVQDKLSKVLPTFFKKKK